MFETFLGDSSKQEKNRPYVAQFFSLPIRREKRNGHQTSHTTLEALFLRIHHRATEENGWKNGTMDRN